MNEIKSALKTADPMSSLRALAERWSANGLTKKQIYAKFEQFLEHMRAKEFSELDEEHVLAIMDMLTGWANPPLLPDEELE